MAKSKNKLYTLAYFRHALKRSGIWSEVLIDKFPEDDNRYWMLSIDKRIRINCTCHKFEENGEIKYNFLFSDGKQNLPIDWNMSTASMKCIIGKLKAVQDKFLGKLEESE